MANTSDPIFSQFKPLSFRGIKVPMRGQRRVGFRHELTQHKFQFGDDEYPEPLGRGGLTFRYTIVMREGIARGPYKHLFLKTLRQFFEAFQDRTPGPLEDPVHGKFTVLPGSYDETLDVALRDGVDIEVDFVNSPEPGETAVSDGLSSIQGIASMAGLMAQQIAAQEYEQEEQKKALVDPFTAVAGLFDQIENIGTQINATVDKVAYQMDKVTASIDAATDPELWSVRDNAQRVKDSALRLKDTAGNPAGLIRELTLDAAMTSSAVADTVGTTVQELLDANPELAEQPLVPKGTTIRYPAQQ